MTAALVDTSVLIYLLRGVEAAGSTVLEVMRNGRLHASEITRLEVLAGMRPPEEQPTRALLDTLIWHPVESAVAERAGALGRRWRRPRDRCDSRAAARTPPHSQHPASPHVRKPGEPVLTVFMSQDIGDSSVSGHR